jgi:hypothetical protein
MKRNAASASPSVGMPRTAGIQAGALLDLPSTVAPEVAGTEVTAGFTLDAVRLIRRQALEALWAPAE